MELPKAEVLILNFCSNAYFLPPFIDDMPKLRALIVINHGPSNATLENFTLFTNLANLRSLWLEKVSVPHLFRSTVPFKNLHKISLVLCKINNSFEPWELDLPQIFPRVSELTIDHSDDLVEFPSSLCGMTTLKSLSITNCHNFISLPSDLGKLKLLQILRLYACPSLRTLPHSLCELVQLKYLDISQCISLTCLPEDIGSLVSLEKIEMRECALVSLPRSASSLQSLRKVVCDDDEVSWLWKQAAKGQIATTNFHIQVAEKCFNLDWLRE